MAFRYVIVIVESGRGESRVKVAVEVMRWNVASSMNFGASGSRSSSSSLFGSRFGFLGGVRWGVGMSMWGGEGFAEVGLVGDCAGVGGEGDGCVEACFG